MTGGAASQRIDKWLWCARVFRTREQAASFVEEQTVRLTRGGQTQRVGKPGFNLKEGDEIALILSGRPKAYRVLAFALRRGSAQEAAALFEALPVS